MPLPGHSPTRTTAAYRPPQRPPSDATNYVYDESGALKQMTLPSGTVIAYIIDGRGRRIGKRVIGTLTKQWIYDGQLRIAAELTGTTLNRFVYRAGTTPEMMLQ